MAYQLILQLQCQWPWRRKYHLDGLAAEILAAFAEDRAHLLRKRYAAGIFGIYRRS